MTLPVLVVALYVVQYARYLHMDLLTVGSYICTVKSMLDLCSFQQKIESQQNILVSTALVLHHYILYLFHTTIPLHGLNDQLVALLMQMMFWSHEIIIFDSLETFSHCKSLFQSSNVEPMNILCHLKTCRIIASENGTPTNTLGGVHLIQR